MYLGCSDQADNAEQSENASEVGVEDDGLSTERLDSCVDEEDDDDAPLEERPSVRASQRQAGQPLSHLSRVKRERWVA